jgi:tripartite-type tricarboxylate transporter receptor subunit TctC
MGSPRTTRRALLARAAAASVAALAWPALRAEPGFPSKPITIIVPVSTGGMLDGFQRDLNEMARPYLNNQPILIENKPGASMLMGTDAIARVDKGDGYLLTQAVAPQLRMPLMREVRFDPFKDLTYIISLVSTPVGIAVRAESPFKTMADLLAAAKASPTGLNYAVTGIATGPHLLMEEVARLKGVKVTAIPVKGGGEATQAVLGGHVDFYCDAGTWAPYVANGTMRLLMHFGEGRLKKFPAAPPATEAGIQLVYSSPTGIVGPKNMDPAIVKALHDAFRKATEDPRYAALLDRYELTPRYLNPADFLAERHATYEAERRMLASLNLLKK